MPVVPFYEPEALLLNPKSPHFSGHTWRQIVVGIVLPFLNGLLRQKWSPQTSLDTTTLAARQSIGL